MLRRRSRRALCALCAVATFAASLAVTAVGTSDSASIERRDVTIIADGNRWEVRAAQKTVGAILEEAGVTLGPADIVTPKTNARLPARTPIRIVRVVEQVEVQEQPIAFATKRRPVKELRVGLTSVVSQGERGLKNLYYKVRYEDGAAMKREFIRAEVVRQPKDRVILIGDKGALAFRGSFTSRRVLKMRASAYDPGPRSCGRSADGRTSTGMKAGYGVVAVDPRVIPLGSRLYIEGYGFAIAGDRGRAIKGHRIDLGFDTYYSARRFGRRQVTVHVLE